MILHWACIFQIPNGWLLGGWFELMILSTLCCLPQKKKYVQSIIKAEFLMPHIVSVSKMMTDGFFRAHTISFNDLLQTFLTSLDGVIYPKNRNKLEESWGFNHLLTNRYRFMNEWMICWRIFGRGHEWKVHFSHFKDYSLR